MYHLAPQTKAIFETVPVVPVLVVDDATIAAPLAQALVDGGLHVLEVTLRTPAALDVITEMNKVEGAVVGAGTLLGGGDVDDAVEAGAQFGVSPGSSDDLLDACNRHNLPLLPGAATATEVMRLRSLGFNMLKFFPAEAIGGIPVLKGISGPIPDVNFCPTGGVSTANYKDYLALPNVVCVGGSWIVTPQLIADQAWDTIRDRAAAVSR